ncbi:Global transcription regulator sge1 [Linderina macrospora]|uniref:Global transcription regulator sge1 n=1 Tax=Linderina macrospora TaxID=4868 RepID=A0ACC1JE31_9FUNG|nr:Global transcription regulator sge1 [Linderina macrospora]
MDVPLDAVGKMLDSQNERQHLQSHHVQQQQLQMQQQQQQFQMEQMHQLQQQQQPGQQQRAQRRATKPCYEFLRKGRCKRGSECNFQHVSLAEAMAMDPNLPATVVAGAQQSMMANGAGMPVFAPGTQFGSAPQPQQLPQQQQQQFYNNGGAQRPPPNNDAPMSTTAVYVTNIPDEALSEESVREFFGKFGTIVSVRMDFQRHSAHIDYTEPQAQQQALSTPEAIFNNRFVRVLKGRLPRGAAAPSADASAGASAPPAEPAVPIWRPKSARIKKAELIDKYVKQQKSYFDKLKTPGLTADMKSVIMSSLKTISAKLAELQKPSAPPVAAAAATPESPAPACRQNVLPRITRRLTDSEKEQIGDGTIVVFDEKEAKMKRWTDGRQWTPSRIMGNFLVYREVERKLQPSEEAAVELERWNHEAAHGSGAFSSHKGMFFPKLRGLMKKTISLNVPDNEQAFLAQTSTRAPRMHQQHLIAYFLAETTTMLPSPDDMEELQSLKLPFSMLCIQKFRRPLSVDIIDDNDYEVLVSEKEDDDEAPAPRPESPQMPERYSVAAIEPLPDDQPALQLPHMPPGGPAADASHYFQMAGTSLPFLQAMAESPHLLNFQLSDMYTDTLVHPMALAAEPFPVSTIRPQDSLQGADGAKRTDDGEKRERE